MKKLVSALIAALGLSGCVAVPVSEPPGAYYAPSATVVVRPYGYYGYGHYYYGPRNYGPRYYRGG